MGTSVSMVVTAGRYRDNRRGVLEVRPMAVDLAEIVIHQPGHFDVPPTTTRIVLSGEHGRDVIADLRAAADALEAALDNGTAVDEAVAS